MVQTKFDFSRFTYLGLISVCYLFLLSACGNGGSIPQTQGITPVIMQQGKFMIDKTDVERRVMNNQVSAIDKGDKIINDAGKAGLIA